MLSPTHIIWDWNGTLLNDMQAGLNAINRMLQERQLPLLDRERYRALFGFPVRDFYHTIGLNPTACQWDALAQEFHHNFLRDPTISLHREATTILDYLSASGVNQSILSASKETILRQMLHDYQIAHFFDHICGLNNLDGESKLNLGKVLLERLSITPQRILLIGDSLHDFEVATHLRTQCLLIAQGHQSSARLQTSGAPVLTSLAELPIWLQHHFKWPPVPL